MIRYLTMVILAFAITWVGASMASSKSYDAQVSRGLVYFRKQANEQLPLTEKLLAALKSNDLDRAKIAYVNSRPPYEEIEVYAASFEDEDRDIDARPYAIDGGETSPEFKGFHRIEALIYRDGNLKDAVPYGDELVKSIKSLIVKLNNPKNFNAALNFKGMLALATEVPAKKISSEEETWSDQSLLIFKHNWIGIHSQFQPYKSVVGKAIAEEEETAFQNCLKSVESYFQEGQVAATPYSQVSISDRGVISNVSYRYRDVLLKAKAALKIPDAM